MKHLFLITALLLPGVAAAIPTPIEDIERLASFERGETIALAPALPIVAEGEAGVCAMPMTAQSDAQDTVLMALCLGE